MTFIQQQQKLTYPKIVKLKMGFGEQKAAFTCARQCSNCKQFSVDTTLHGNETKIHFRVRIQPFHESLPRVELAIPAEKCFAHQIRGQTWKLETEHRY